MASDPVVHVIDDDRAAREALAFLIDCAGYDVRAYESAARFLDHAPAVEPGCIVTDMRMPEMSGIDLIARLKEIGVHEPVILITGHADMPMAVRAMQQGAAFFIEKPFSEEAIVGAVRAALDSGRMSDALAAERERIVLNLEMLSPREREVLDGLAEGRANTVIAHELAISARAVEVHRTTAMTKMGAEDLAELVRMITVARLPART